MASSTSALASTIYSHSERIHVVGRASDSAVAQEIHSWGSTSRANANGQTVGVVRVPVASLAVDSVAASANNSNTVLVSATDVAALVPLLFAKTSQSLVAHVAGVDSKSAHALVGAVAHVAPLVVLLGAHPLLAHAVAAPGLPAVSIYSDSNVITESASAFKIEQKSAPVNTDAIASVEAAIASLPFIADKPSFFKYSGPAAPTTVLIVSGFATPSIEQQLSTSSIGVLRVQVYRPWSAAHLQAALPLSVQRVAVLDISNAASSFGFLFLDVVSSLIGTKLGESVKEVRVKGDLASVGVVHEVLKAAESREATPFVLVNGDLTNEFANLTLGEVLSNETDIEGPYVSLLAQIFKERLNLANVVNESSVLQPVAAAAPQQSVSSGRSRFIEQAKAVVASGTLSAAVASPLQAWIAAQASGAADSVSLGRKAHDVLGTASSYKQELRDFYAESGAYLLSAPQQQPSSATAPTAQASTLSGTSAEFGLGLHLSQLQQRERFVLKAKTAIAAGSLPKAAIGPLAAWIEAQTVGNSSASSSVAHGQEAYKQLGDSSAATQPLREFYAESAAHLLSKPPSRWLLGGDRLAYDIGSSGVHHVIASKANVNILILDTQPYTEKKNPSSADVRKKDIGLYAMTYGGVYVASVALQSSFAGVVRALSEADAYNGPSVIIAYAPRVPVVPGSTGSAGNGVLVKGGAGLAATAALAALKETKQAVDEGYWPLYRWTPQSVTSGEAQFHLDSEKMRGELESFLERDRRISMIAAAEPTLAIPASIEAELKENVENKIKDSYKALIANLNTTPVLILYGSDGGVAANAAKRLAAEAKQRGLKPKVSIMDEYAVEDFVGHEHVVFVVSTAGQGEFPGNSRETWKALQQLKKGGEVDFGKMRFAVFAMGDSHYWPLPEDAHFFCKSGKDLDAKLEALGAPRLVKVGLGNDRDADGWQTGYRTFTADLWASLGVDSVEVSGAAVLVPSDDAIKESSNFLRGTIAPGLLDTSTGALCELDTRITKFHGIYQQDDRDIREARLRAGLEVAYSFMVRVRVPGGVSSAKQWIAIDDIADKLANGTIKLTTRQAFQFHGIVKSKLKKSIQEINHALMDTIAACGDVNRNVMCNPNPTSSNVHRQVLEFSKKFSDHLTPNTNAYHEIWLDKKMVVTSEDVEPIYGKTYLPRKFKVAVAVPPHNDVDVFAHDLGYIAVTEGDNLIGFNVTVGGGMGMTHGMKTTYPRLGDFLGYVTVAQAVEVGEKVVTVQRDFGDRTNRKHARLKYTIDDRGIDWFRGEVEARLGYKLQPARPYTFTSNGDRYGWSEGVKGVWAYTLFIQNGRVKDESTRLMKTGLRAIAEDFVRRDVQGIEFRLTPNQHLMIAGVPASEKWKLDAFLKKYELENGNLSGLRQNSMACVALPTCALAMAESERYLPDLVGKIEDVLAANGLREEAITIRMTGCPNGCARPQMAEIAFIGKAPGTYNMYLGGGFAGERLNKIYRENVTEPEIIALLTPLIQDYSRTKIDGEHFGDFVIRKGYIKATTAGKYFHDV
ncbi:UNVERIFIED_CONTAM: hypothetical protein HDU68_009364 [Siphonaria sp. JEL0065]|nr:hypothetical protein HDU68_009364 [Siphonaria sp. JEL0065]